MKRKETIDGIPKEFREDMFGTWMKSESEYCVFERAKKSSRGAYIKYKWKSQYGIERQVVDKRYAFMLVETLRNDGYRQTERVESLEGGVDKLVGWFSE